MIVLYFFFVSSRRRHTRWPRDWSSDVCSSDLGGSFAPVLFISFDSKKAAPMCYSNHSHFFTLQQLRATTQAGGVRGVVRSEERRVGKEWRCRRTRNRRKKKVGRRKDRSTSEET